MVKVNRGIIGSEEAMLHSVVSVWGMMVGAYQARASGLFDAS